jgi:ubiquinone/menaquinone biosynthesis C-methylase UbiE
MAVHNNKEVLRYWDRTDVESMYDKHLIGAEIELIRCRLRRGAKILDAGCGEGEGTAVYAAVPGVTVHAVDFSETRLRKAARRLRGKKNVLLKKVDFLQPYELDDDYDFIVSQRFLINLVEWRHQKKVLLDLMAMLKKGGKLFLLEGSMQGVDELNSFRKLFSLKPIPVKWHNLFFKDMQLIQFMKSRGFSLVEEDGLGEYFLLTRGVRPLFEADLSWQSPFNKKAARAEVQRLMKLHGRFSRLKLWVFR